MLSAEELKQISDIMENQLQPIKKDIGEMKTDIEGIKTDIENMKTDIDAMKKDIEEIKYQATKTRVAANLAIEWIDTYFKEEYPLSDMINNKH